MSLKKMITLILAFAFTSTFADIKPFEVSGVYGDSNIATLTIDNKTSGTIYFRLHGRVDPIWSIRHKKLQGWYSDQANVSDEIITFEVEANERKVYDKIYARGHSGKGSFGRCEYTGPASYLKITAGTAKKTENKRINSRLGKVTKPANTIFDGVTIFGGLSGKAICHRGKVDLPELKFNVLDTDKKDFSKDNIYASFKSNSTGVVITFEPKRG